MVFDGAVESKGGGFILECEGRCVEDDIGVDVYVLVA